MSQSTYKVVAGHPVDTDDGELVAPGKTFSAAPSERLEGLAVAGLVEVEATPKPSPVVKPPAPIAPIAPPEENP